MMDKLRTVNCLAVEYGKKQQHAKTGFLHLDPLGSPEDGPYMVPLLENLLFCLSLFRTRMGDSIQEAKSLLERILFLQDPVQGNFPVYLHQFPRCPYYWQAVKMLPAFFWIYKDFSHVLSKELKQSLEKTLETFLSFYFSSQKERPASYPHRVILESAFRSLGSLWGKKEWAEACLAEAKETKFWYSPRALSDCMLGIQMHSNEKWNPLLQHLKKVWHGSLQSYVGLPLQEYQREREGEVTYLDLGLGGTGGSFTKRILSDAPGLLQGALYRPFSLGELEDELDVESQWEGRRYYLKKTPSWAFSVVEYSGDPPADPGVHAFRLVWKGKERIHSFVLPKGRYSLTYEKVENGVNLNLSLPDSFFPENHKEGREIAFYYDLCENSSCTVNAQKASAWRLGDEILLKSEGFCFSLAFTLRSGEGAFFGHFSRGNRPSQQCLKGSLSNSVFDEILFLRTVRRPGPCDIQVKIRFEMR